MHTKIFLLLILLSSSTNIFCGGDLENPAVLVENMQNAQRPKTSLTRLMKIALPPAGIIIGYGSSFAAIFSDIDPTAKMACSTLFGAVGTISVLSTCYQCCINGESFEEIIIEEASSVLGQSEKEESNTGGSDSEESDGS